jgi:tRNA nucleotidyltransferase (CCA-adding enzyme)
VPELATIDDVTIASLDYLPMPAGPKASARRTNRLTALFMGLTEAAARHALRALRFSNLQVDWIATLAGHWHLLGDDITRALESGEEPTIPDATTRQWVATVGRTRIAAFMDVATARWSAARALGALAPSDRAAATLHDRLVHAAFNDAIQLSDLAIDGDDLLRAGIAPGPRIGEILRQLLAVVLDDPTVNTPARLIALAQSIAQGRPPADS